MVADFDSQVASGIVDVAENDKVLLGFVVLYPQTGTEETPCLFVENVAVVPGYSGRKIGTSLMSHAEDKARELGLTSIRLYTNALMTQNLTWYPSLGFRKTGRVTEDGFDRVYFQKDLVD